MLECKDESLILCQKSKVWRYEQVRKPVFPLFDLPGPFPRNLGGICIRDFPWMQSLGDTTFRYAMVNISLRLLVWVLPVFLYLRSSSIMLTRLHI